MAGGPFLLTPEEQEAWEREQREQREDPLEVLRRNINNPVPAGAPPRPPENRAPDRPRPSPSFFGGQMFSNNGSEFARGGFNTAQAMAGQQGSHLGGMIGQVQQALGDEHDSRVAQERERRRMEHEKELMRMRMEAQRRADEATLIRSILGM